MEEKREKQLQRSETKVIVPFSYNGDTVGKDFDEVLSLSSSPIGEWVLCDSGKRNYAKYLLSHVNKDLAKCHNYDFAPKNQGFYCTYILISGFDGDSGEEYKFELSDITIRYFSTGIGMVILTLRYDKQTTLQQIINISAALSRFYRNDTSHEYFDKTSNQTKVNPAKTRIETLYHEQISIADIINTSLGGPIEGIRLFPGTDNKRAFVFHRIVGIPSDNDLVNLQDNLWAGSPENGELDRVELGTDHFCLVSSKTMCHVTISAAETEGDLLRQQNIDGSYLLMYLLVIHEQQVLFKYYEQVKDFISKENNTGRSKMTTKNARYLKASLLEALTDYSFEVISEEKYYQKLFLHYRKELGLESLESNLGGLITTINDELASRRERLINALLGVITIFSITSVLGDITGVVGVFTESLIAKQVSVFISAIAICVLALIVYLKDRNENK